METVLLVGFPNSGKSTIFNSLSGKMRKVTNYSGITVDEGRAELKSNRNYEQKVQIVDLPGIYNLNPSSMDEAVTVQRLISGEKYNLVAAVLDMDRLEASLSLCLSLKEVVGDNLVLIVNKDDTGNFNNKGRKKLEELTGLKVLSLSARYQNERELDRFLRDYTKEFVPKKHIELQVSNDSLEYFNKKEELKKNLNIVTAENIASKINMFHKEARQIIKESFQHENQEIKLTEKIDKIILHPILGSAIFIAVFYLIFLSIYEWSGPMMDLIDGGMSGLGEWVGSKLPEGLLKSLVVDGAIAGVGAVVIFLPQIMILFFLLSILEQSGYIARAAVLSDKVMARFGLNGKAFLPFLSGFACSIPGIMAARTIPDKKERMATLLTIPLITCSARLPVYILLIGTFVPSKAVFGIFNSQALSFFFLYFLGSFFALLMSKIFRLSFFKGKSSSFFMDLPLYQRPSLRLAIKQAYLKGKVFLKKAGTIILALSIIIWFASSFPRPNEAAVSSMSKEQVSAYTLQNSYLGTAGKIIEPAIKPIGMDWKMGIGLLTAFGARELFVSTMGTIYALGDVDEESNSLRQRLLKEKDPLTNKPVFNLAVAWSLLIFFVFAMQCMSTLAVIKRETDSWMIPLYATLYMGALAYGGSFIVYHLLI